MQRYASKLKVKWVGLSNKEVRRIYHDAFRPSERMPMFMMVFMSLFGNTRFEAFYDSGTLCGFLYYAFGMKQIFLMFFAVDKTLRGRGYGKEMLDSVANRFPNKVIITSIGDDTGDDAETVCGRRSFYEKCGFAPSGYNIRMNGITEEVLTRNGEFSKSRFRTFMALYSFGTQWPKIWKREDKR